MKKSLLAILPFLLIASCNKAEKSLFEARQAFKTTLTRQQSAKEPVPAPPEGVFRLVRYDAAAGKLAAYLSPDPGDGKRHPAIVWITGGDSNTIGDVWSEAPASNDQSASAFRKAGIVMMFPSLRGGNDNPGFKEGFYGETDDILAAANYLAQQPYVDPERIYLGGHSTGGTLVLLTAALPNRFRAAFSFGPVEDVSFHRPEHLPFDASNAREVELRSPKNWLHSITTPTFVFEGSYQANLDSLQAMKALSKNPKLHFHPILGGNHFNILAPINRLIAAKILQDQGATSGIEFSDEELRGAMRR